MPTPVVSGDNSSPLVAIRLRGFLRSGSR